MRVRVLLEVKKSRCQEVKPLSVLRTKITSVISLPSCLLDFRSSDCYPLPSPTPREGALTFNCQGTIASFPIQGRIGWVASCLFTIKFSPTHLLPLPPREGVCSGWSGYVPGININLSSKTGARDKKLSKSVLDYENTRVR